MLRGFGRSVRSGFGSRLLSSNKPKPPSAMEQLRKLKQTLTESKEKEKESETPMAPFRQTSKAQAASAQPSPSTLSSPPPSPPQQERTEVDELDHGVELRHPFYTTAVEDYERAYPDEEELKKMSREERHKAASQFQESHLGKKLIYYTRGEDREDDLKFYPEEYQQLSPDQKDNLRPDRFDHVDGVSEFERMFDEVHPEFHKETRVISNQSLSDPRAFYGVVQRVLRSNPETAALAEFKFEELSPDALQELNLLAQELLKSDKFEDPVALLYRSATVAKEAKYRIPSVEQKAKLQKDAEDAFERDPILEQEHSDPVYQLRKLESETWERTYENYLEPETGFSDARSVTLAAINKYVQAMHAQWTENEMTERELLSLAQELEETRKQKKAQLGAKKSFKEKIAERKKVAQSDDDSKGKKDGISSDKNSNAEEEGKPGLELEPAMSEEEMRTFASFFSRAFLGHIGGNDYDKPDLQSDASLAEGRMNAKLHSALTLRESDATYIEAFKDASFDGSNEVTVAGGKGQAEVEGVDEEEMKKKTRLEYISQAEEDQNFNPGDNVPLPDDLQLIRTTPDVDWENTAPFFVEDRPDDKIVDEPWVILRNQLVKKKGCPLCVRNRCKPLVPIDYTNIRLLNEFLDPMGWIEPKRFTGICSKRQRQISHAIKTARSMGLLPYNNKWNFGVFDPVSSLPRSIFKTPGAEEVAAEMEKNAMEARFQFSGASGDPQDPSVVADYWYRAEQRLTTAHKMMQRNDDLGKFLQPAGDGDGPSDDELMQAAQDMAEDLAFEADKL